MTLSDTPAASNRAVGTDGSDLQRVLGDIRDETLVRAADIKRARPAELAREGHDRVAAMADRNLIAGL